LGRPGQERPWWTARLPPAGPRSGFMSSAHSMEALMPVLCQRSGAPAPSPCGSAEELWALKVKWRIPVDPAHTSQVLCDVASSHMYSSTCGSSLQFLWLQLVEAFFPSVSWRSALCFSFSCGHAGSLGQHCWLAYDCSCGSQRQENTGICDPVCSVLGSLLLCPKPLGLFKSVCSQLNFSCFRQPP
jgi:hypothetical protein